MRASLEAVVADLKVTALLGVAGVVGREVERWSRPGDRLSARSGGGVYVAPITAAETIIGRKAELAEVLQLSLIHI